MRLPIPPNADRKYLMPAKSPVWRCLRSDSSQDAQRSSPIGKGESPRHPESRSVTASWGPCSLVCLTTQGSAAKASAELLALPDRGPATSLQSITALRGRVRRRSELQMLAFVCCNPKLAPRLLRFQATRGCFGRRGISSTRRPLPVAVCIRDGMAARSLRGRPPACTQGLCGHNWERFRVDRSPQGSVRPQPAHTEESPAR